MPRGISLHAKEVLLDGILQELPLRHPGFIKKKNNRQNKWWQHRLLLILDMFQWHIFWGVQKPLG